MRKHSLAVKVRRYKRSAFVADERRRARYRGDSIAALAISDMVLPFALESRYTATISALTRRESDE